MTLHLFEMLCDGLYVSRSPEFHFGGTTGILPGNPRRGPLGGHHSKARPEDFVLKSLFSGNGNEAHHRLGRVGHEFNGHLLLEDDVVDCSLAFEDASGCPKKRRHEPTVRSIIIRMESVVGCGHHVIAQELVDSLDHR